jgi:Protein of unknown function (DUF3108)
MSLIMPLALAILLAGMGVIPAPPSIPHESGSIVVTATKQQRWTAEWTMEPAQENGRPAVHFTETGRGQYSGFSGPVSWTTDALWSADGHFRPLRFEKIIKDKGGHVVGAERKIFGPAKDSAKFTRERGGKAAESQQFSVPEDTLAPEGIAGILRFLPFEHWQTQSVHLFSNEPRLYEMKIEMRGKERVKTPAGEFECYNVELVPQLGALNLFRAFLPKAHFWFSVAQPHFWVRYEGPENGPGTPQIIMELKTYEPK